MQQNLKESILAKLHASLAWVLGKAYKDKVPSEFQDPLYKNNAGEWHVKPRLVNLLTTSELYCQACSNMFGDSSSQWQGHWSIIQVLSRKGIYVMGTNDEDITETVLMHTAPFKVHAHLALIDALMQAYAKEVVTVERVVKAVRRFTVFNASTDLPDDLEDTVLLWINKVCAHLQHMLNKKEEQILEGETTQKVKIVRKSTPQDSISVPVMENFLSDVGDGCSLAVLVSFYCPQLRRLEDICLKASVGIADSLYNLRLVKTFCDKHLPSKIFHLTYEDLLYTHENLKMNILVMVTELFYWFEIKRAPCVTGGMFSSIEESADVPKSAKFAVPNIPISNATKQSFQKLRSEDLRSSSTPDIHRAGSTGPVQPQRQVLLQKRHQHLAAQHHLETDNLQLRESSRGVRRANSLSSHDRSPVKQSVIAWPEIPKEQNGLMGNTSLSKGINLLANVSIDSELNESFSSESIDLGEFETSPRIDSARTYSKSENLCPADIRESSHPDYLEVESVNSGVPSRISSVEQSKSKGDNIEPLLPARIKPAKEKTNNHTKEEERGDDDSKRRSPKILKPGVETFSDEIKSESSGSNFDDDRITPLPEDQLTARSEYLIPPVQGQVTPGTQQRKGFEAFLITGSIGDSQVIESHRSNVSKETGHSYTVADHILTPETARAAGIPVVSDDSDIKASREGSVSSRSSGDFSDHESRKIHKDHKTRESDEMKRPCDTILSKVQMTVAPEAYRSQKPFIVSDQPTKILDNAEKAKNTTSFAQMKRLKENLGTIDNSAFVYMQHGTEGLRSPLKETCPKKVEKRTTFAPLPNQTTWHENAQSSNSSPEDTCQNQENGGGDVSQPVPAELLKIRLKLEEKRKSIEKKKRQAEIQQQKMRQRLGKAAFLHVVAKPKEKSMEEDGSEETDKSSLSRSELSTSTGQGSTSQFSFRERSNEQHIEASTDSSRSIQEDEFDTPPQSPTQQVKSSRAFSREDIQQTIENVRKKWFKDDEDVGSKPVSSDQSESSGMSSSQSSVEKDMSRSGTEKGDNYEEYSSSLDRLNRSLTDLQGEIMKLSLKKDKIQSSISDVSAGAKSKVRSPRVSPLRSESVESSTRSRSGSRSPTKPMEVTKKTLPAGPENFSQGGEHEYVGYPAHTDTGQFPDRAYVQSQGHVIPPVMSHARTMSQPQANTMTHPPTYPHDFQPYALQSPSHITGPIYPNPSQYGHVAPSLGMQPGGHYGGYIMGPGTQQHIGLPPYQHSPSHLYPNGPGQMFPHGYSPHTMHLTSPPNQPYPHSMYGSPSQPVPPYQSSLHSDVAHTISSHPQHSMMPSSHVAESAVPYSGNGFQPRPDLVQTTQESSTSVETAMQILNQDLQPKTRPTEEEVEDLQYTQDQASCDSSETERLGDSSVPIDSELLPMAKPEGGGFFVSIGAESPRRQKPKMKAHKEKTIEQKVAVPQPDEKPFETGQELDKAGLQQDDSVLSEQHTPGVGFMIGQDESPVVKDDLDMQRKKEKLVQMQQRRREEQERKRMEKEAELARKREEERLKQDEAERRKGEEKARREIIFQQYLQRKENEDDGYLKKPDKAARQKMRPKSMYTKALDGPERNSNETYDTSMSISCNVLSTPPGPEDLEQGLAFGGLTHRRPPSPDLDRLRLGNKGSNDSSEAGSTSGSDYTGPKLFVKPSSKSNRHIIINALSHCCLAGSVNTELKNKVLEELAKSDAKHFIILFRDAGCQYRGLYAYNPDVDEISKIHGVGPKHFNNKMIEKYFKYNSGSKSFSCVTSTKHLSVSIDAIVLHNTVWKQFSKQPVKK
ncbi:hypothetical protein CHS0354_021003 [Potamilus streckersoni]|uniref:Uncharacterized protein n=1 Tax=Potamilus streckersoni TaxID=2493646 RepID=A0AAE0VK47_9BIVA|nr:hypothetical protein CHS0354_021003 [Potamilus streckersoni]